MKSELRKAAAIILVAAIAVSSTTPALAQQNGGSSPFRMSSALSTDEAGSLTDAAENEAGGTAESDAGGPTDPDETGKSEPTDPDPADPGEGGSVDPAEPGEGESTEPTEPDENEVTGQEVPMIPLEPAQPVEEQQACDKTEGCILTAGHEGECQVAQAAPVMLANGVLEHDIGAGNVEIGAHDDGICPGHIITGSSSSIWSGQQHKIAFSGGEHTVTLRDVTVDPQGGLTQSAMDIANGSQVTLVLEGSNTLNGNLNHPGIWVEPGSSLTIEGDGSLYAQAKNGTASMGAAGIGSSYGVNTNFGDITINGGCVIAVGGRNNSSCGAGIGSGENANYAGTVTISGGVVYVQAGNSDATSIGGGRDIGASGNGTFIADGNAVIVNPGRIGDRSHVDEWSGIFIYQNGSEAIGAVDQNTASLSGDTITLNNAHARVFGEVTLDYDLVVDSSSTLEIFQGGMTSHDEHDGPFAVGKLIVPAGVNLNNDGKILISDNALLRLEGGKPDTSGSGILTVPGTGKLEALLTDDLVSFGNTADITFDGKNHLPEAGVHLVLWGYEQSLTEGTDYNKSITGERQQESGYELGRDADKLTVSVEAIESAQSHLLFNGTKVSDTLTIQPADFNAGISSTYTVKEGEDQLLSRLDKANITWSNSIDPVHADEQSRLKSGTLTWTLNGAALQNDSLKDYKAGDVVTLKWSYAHTEGNFVSPKTGEVKVTISQYAPKNTAIFENTSNISSQHVDKRYGTDTVFYVEVKLDYDDTAGENWGTPKTQVEWSVNEKDIVSIEPYGTMNEKAKITILNATGETRADTVEINAFIPEYSAADPGDCYAATSREFDLHVLPKEVEISSVEAVDRMENGSSEVEVRVTTKEPNWKVGSDDVALIATGTMTDAAAGTNKPVKVSYQFIGADAGNYVIKNPLNTYVDISKDPSGGGSGGSGGGSSSSNDRDIDVTVRIVWEDEENAAGQRPEEVEVQLYRDHRASGEPVVLNERGDWDYKWKDLSNSYLWTVAAAECPEGYSEAVTREDWHQYVITFTYGETEKNNPDTGR